MKTTIFRTALASAAALALMAGPAAAANDGSTATVTGSTLAVNSMSAADFTATLTGETQTVTAAFAAQVEDPRGTGAGWNVTVNPSQFAVASSTKTLGTDALSLSNAVVTPGTDSSAVGSPASGALPAGQATTLLSATASGQGMGTYDIAATLNLKILASDYAGAYTSTITVDIAAL